MIKDQIVRVKLKKQYHEQRPFSYVGKVVAFGDAWVVIDGKGLMVARQQPNGVQVDASVTRTVVPRDNIESIRILPDSFDVKNIQATTEGQQLVLVVPDGLPVFVGELGEG